MATHFIYSEQHDYIPIYVYLPEELFEGEDTEDLGEIGLFIDGECYGAEPIMGELVQINAYIMDMDLDDVEIEFMIHNGARSVGKVGSYAVFNSELQSFEPEKLDLSSGEMFYVVSIKTEHLPIEAEELPAKTALLGNYPNPFNPSTSIRFALSQPENVSLKIYNIRGQLVRTLADEMMDAGEHVIIWHGDDSNGVGVASGIYFTRFETSSGVETRRMVLMK